MQLHNHCSCSHLALIQTRHWRIKHLKERKRLHRHVWILDVYLERNRKEKKNDKDIHMEMRSWNVIHPQTNKLPTQTSGTRPWHLGNLECNNNQINQFLHFDSSCCGLYFTEPMNGNCNSLHYLSPNVWSAPHMLAGALLLLEPDSKGCIWGKDQVEKKMR